MTPISLVRVNLALESLPGSGLQEKITNLLTDLMHRADQSADPRLFINCLQRAREHHALEAAQAKEN